jgi:hypothetical protein
MYGYIVVVVECHEYRQDSEDRMDKYRKCRMDERTSRTSCVYPEGKAWLSTGAQKKKVRPERASE